MCLGSAPARYGRRREGTSSEKVKKRLCALRTRETASRNRPQTRNGRVRCARDERTQHPQRSVVRVFLEPRGAGRRCAGPRQRRHSALGSSEVPTSVGTGAGVDAPTNGDRGRGCAARLVTHAVRPASHRSRPRSPLRPASPVSRLVSPADDHGPRMSPRPAARPRPAAIVGSVIGLAIVVALGAWFLLLRPGPEHRLASPSPSAIVVVTPSPEPPPPRAHGRADGRGDAARDAHPDALQGADLHRQDPRRGAGARRDRRSPAGYPVRPDDQSARWHGPVPGPAPGSSVLPGDQIVARRRAARTQCARARRPGHRGSRCRQPAARFRP